MLDKGNNNPGFTLTPTHEQKDCFLELDKKDLVRALSHTQSVVERKNIIPILSNVLITTTNDFLQLSATDMDILISERINIKTARNLSITVNAHLFYEIARKLDDKFKVKLSLLNDSDKYINISCGNSNFDLPTLPADEFPKLDDFNYTCKFTISSIELKRLIDECKFSMSNEETRYNLSGIYLHYYNSTMRLVSTDGHRLSLAFSKKLEDLKQFAGVIIPKKTITELRKIIEELDESIEISLASNKVLFKGKDFSLLSKLIDAKFPEYDGLIPKSNDIKIQIPVSAFSSVIDRVATITNEKFRGLKFILEKNSLLVTASDDIGNKATEIIEVETDYMGKLEIGFNFRYLLDVMHVIKGSTVKCSFKDPFAPTIIEDTSNANFKYIVMPMRI